MDTKVTLVWEDIPVPQSDNLHVRRAKVPGGWLVIAYNGNDPRDQYAPSITFYPDPNHQWDGGSLP